MEQLVFAAALLALILVERLPGLRFQASPFWRSFAATDLFYLATSGVALSALVRRGAESLFAPVIVPLSSGMLFAGGLVVYDLGAYLSHVALHRSDFLWRVHKVHHSSRTLDWLATFRGHLLEHLLRNLASPVLLIALGFPVAIVGAIAAVHGAWSAFGHSNLDLPLRALEPIFITPRMHRKHHVPATSDRNFGNVFSVWDRLFDTLSIAPGAEGSALGVPGEVLTYPQTWRRQLLEPFRSGSSTAAADDSPSTQVGCRSQIAECPARPPT